MPAPLRPALAWQLPVGRRSPRHQRTTPSLPCESARKVHPPSARTHGTSVQATCRPTPTFSVLFSSMTCCSILACFKAARVAASWDETIESKKILLHRDLMNLSVLYNLLMMSFPISPTFVTR